MTDQGVLCRYFFQQTLVEDKGVPPDALSSLLLPSHPKLRQLQRRFPFLGEYHFRVRYETPSSYCWVDLTHPEQEIPIASSNEICIKVLQLSSTSTDPENQYLDPSTVREDFPSQAESYSSRIVQDVSGVFSGVKSLVSKVRQSGMASALHKHSTKVWERVSGQHPASAPPSPQTLQQLSRLIDAFQTPLDYNNNDHIEMLQRLWGSCYELDSFQPQGRQWQQLGFQSDPFEELRVVLALHCVAFFHERYHSTAITIVNDLHQYAASCYQVTFLLADLLQLQDGACVGSARPFWRTFEDPVAFFELFAIAIKALYQSWYTTRDPDTGVHLDYAANVTLEVLRRGPDSIQALLHYAQQVY